MKKIIISILFVITINSNLMAKSGFGVDLMVPLGAGFGIMYNDGKENKSFERDPAFEFGAYLQPNYYFDLSILSIGISLDLGYQRDVFAYKFDSGKGNLSFDSLSIGLMPKIDILFMSIGLGGGVKIPLAAKTHYENNGSSKNTESYSLGGLKEEFNKPFIPYVKASLDFLLLHNFSLGVYVSYDFPFMEQKGTNPKISFAGIDVGGQIGIRF